MAAMLDHLELGLGGNWSATFCGIFVELSIFPDLTQGKAVINQKNLPVEINNATFEEEAEINGEMYVLFYTLSQMIYDLSAQVLKLINKSTAIICL